MASSTQTQQPAGKATQQGRGPEFQVNAVPSGQPLLRRFYSSMLKCRIVAERIANLAREGKVPADRVPEAGLEATLAGVAMRMAAKDLVAPGKLSFMAEVARGAPLSTLFPALCEAGPDAVEEPPSAALALARGGRKNIVVVAFLGADEAGLAGWRKAVQEAGARKLPILFVMESGSGVKESKPAPRTKNAAPFGQAPLITVDGTDVVAVARVARESLRCARAGYGPTLMECKVGAALQALSRASNGKPHVDPIRATEERLAAQGLWSEAWKREVSESLQREINQAVAAAFSSQQSAFSRLSSGIDSKG